ncbi:hypothetical protein OPV22_026569 [Ensete ventricosum]|uniref:Pentacotripeptide-repeat region of PRORP domain-containing protein n=2 Tax=Ensete ventricosum TaxID=4639 RepID=A0AAV8PAW3_ENSVE|nr:hypothetical protein OPV22_026569 [Ensete ventricosum]
MRLAMNLKVTTFLPRPGHRLLSSSSFSASAFASVNPSSSSIAASVDDLAKLINDQPIPVLRRNIPTPFLSSPLVDSLLLRLFAAHVAAPKALYLFRLSLSGHRDHPPSSSAFATILHILTRARHFDAAFELIDDVARSQPVLLTPKSLAVLLSRHAKFRPFDETLAAFDRAERAWAAAGLSFGFDEFNALLGAYCTQGRVFEARAIFRRFYPRFPPNSRTLNTLLLGFKESQNLVAFDLFYHDMMIRGFEPDAVTYCIRMDAYCKKMRFFDALGLLDEMAKKNCSPTVKTITTLIHGAGIAKNPMHARRLFDEMVARGLVPDRGAYNALMGSFVRMGNLRSALEIMEEMEKAIQLDDVSYYTLFCGMKKYEDLEGFWKLYKRMVEKNFVPRTRTVMLLMKVFCENSRADLGLSLWDYLVEKGCCPHRHALDTLVTALCCKGNVVEAYKCFKQVVDRGRVPSDRAFQVLEGFLVRTKKFDMMEELDQMTKRMQALVPSQC